MQDIARFRKAILDYADRSVAILKRTGAQGMIVWDLEGQEFPQKTSYIGDPRLLPRLAPEADLVADEFFGKFRQAGLAVGLTIRPQQLTFDADGTPRQENVGDYERLLLEQDRLCAPPVERNSVLYRFQRGTALACGGVSHSADSPATTGDPFDSRASPMRCITVPALPYGAMQGGGSPTGRAIRWLYPRAFQVLDVTGARLMEGDIRAAYRNGDILLFPAWMYSYMCGIIESLSGHPNYSVAVRCDSLAEISRG